MHFLTYLNRHFALTRSNGWQFLFTTTFSSFLLYFTINWNHIEQPANKILNVVCKSSQRLAFSPGREVSIAPTSTVSSVSESARSTLHLHLCLSATTLGAPWHSKKQNALRGSVSLRARRLFLGCHCALIHSWSLQSRRVCSKRMEENGAGALVWRLRAR